MSFFCSWACASRPRTNGSVDRPWRVRQSPRHSCPGRTRYSRQAAARRIAGRPAAFLSPPGLRLPPDGHAQRRTASGVRRFGPGRGANASPRYPPPQPAHSGSSQLSRILCGTTRRVVEIASLEEGSLQRVRGIGGRADGIGLQLTVEDLLVERRGRGAVALEDIRDRQCRQHRVALTIRRCRQRFFQMLPSIGEPAVDDENTAESEMRLEVGWALDEHVPVDGRCLGSLAVIELEAARDLQLFGGILSRQRTRKAQSCRGECGDHVTSVMPAIMSSAFSERRSASAHLASPYSYRKARTGCTRDARLAGM